MLLYCYGGVIHSCFPCRSLYTCISSYGSKLKWQIKTIKCDTSNHMNTVLIFWYCLCGFSMRILTIGDYRTVHQLTFRREWSPSTGDGLNLISSLVPVGHNNTHRLKLSQQKTLSPIFASYWARLTPSEQIYKESKGKHVLKKRTSWECSLWINN